VSRMRILALEPYYGGSHRAVLDGLVARVDADWSLLTLPARKWKWRMRGAAITMAEQARALAAEPQRAVADRPFDLVFASTFVNLAEFRGLAGATIAEVPAIVYFHENQLVYPNRHTADWDYQFPLTNITSALCAEACVFNTRWNLDRFCAEIPGFIREFPDHHPCGVAEAIAAKSRVIAPPFDTAGFDGVPPSRGERCRIVWPHRWEHDKNPEEFFSAVMALAGEGLDFEVAVAGQSFRETEDLMRDAARALGDRLVYCDEPASRGEYAALLASADGAVSTAVNEFFGLAMVEACYAGAAPLVPDRLAYPELYSREYRYAGADELVARLRGYIQHRPDPLVARGLAERFTFERLVPDYQACFLEVAEACGSAI
jgi:glycosyltransferase involved in cell wall biosynthesis